MRCRYCDNIFSNPIGGELDVHNRILFETENFVAVPTIGSLVEGWLLIVTKEHHICMASIEESLFGELERFKSEVSRQVESRYGPVAIFEHGPSKPNQAIGCGVDHAHLHVVPTSCDLVKGFDNLYKGKMFWKSVNGVSDAIESHRLGFEYLFVEQPMGNASLATAMGFGSQLFRKVIASHIGEPEAFDWKLHLGLENVRATVAKLTHRVTKCCPEQIDVEVISS